MCRIRGYYWLLLCVVYVVIIGCYCVSYTWLLLVVIVCRIRAPCHDIVKSMVSLENHQHFKGLSQGGDVDLVISKRRTNR